MVKSLNKASKKNKKINVLIIGFNRSDLILKSINRLKSINKVEIWISIDGPRKFNKKDLEEIKIIKDICSYKKIKTQNCKFNDSNLGCRKGVIDSINWFFDNVESGIILEDDIELEKDYIFQINYWLEIYSKEKSIGSISSHNSINPPNNERYEKDFFLMPTCRVWGWATWKDRWHSHIKSTIQLQKLNLLQIFFKTPLKVRTFNSALTIWKCLNNEFDTWDYEWNFFHILKGKKSITPNGLYSLNHGFRKDATHTFIGNNPWVEMDNFKFNKKKIISLKNSKNHKLEKIILSECGFPIMENYYLEILKLIKFILKNYKNKLFKYLLRLLHKN